MEKIASGAYRGRVRSDYRSGLFRIRPLRESPGFPEVGVWRQDEELNGRGSDGAMLRRVSAFTGGSVNPEPGDVFAAREQRLDCLDCCLQKLPPDQRDLIVEYYRDGRGQRIEQPA